MAMSKDWKTEIMIVEPYMTVLSASQVKRVAELPGILEKAILADICRAFAIPSYFFEEEGSDGRGPEPPGPSSKDQLQIKRVLGSAIGSDGCQADYNACNDHLVPLLEARDSAAELDADSEENAKADSN